MQKYTNGEIVEDINNAKDLRRILKDEKIKSDELYENYQENSKYIGKKLNIGLIVGLFITLMFSNPLLILVCFIPYAILKIRNEVKLMKFDYYNKVRNLSIKMSLNNLEDLIDDLNIVLESRKGKEIETSKIKNLFLNLSLDSKFYDDLLKIDKSFCPDECLEAVHINRDQYVSKEEYYNFIFDELFIDDTKNKEEYEKVKKIKCNYIFDIKEIKNI